MLTRDWSTTEPCERTSLPDTQSQDGLEALWVLPLIVSSCSPASCKLHLFPSGSNLPLLPSGYNPQLIPCGHNSHLSWTVEQVNSRVSMVSMGGGTMKPQKRRRSQIRRDTFVQAQLVAMPTYSPTFTYLITAIQLILFVLMMADA